MATRKDRSHRADRRDRRDQEDRAPRVENELETHSPEASPSTPTDAEASASESPRRVPSLTNSPGCVPRRAAPLRRTGAVRVDAWAVPAPASWSRTRRIVRKVQRQPQGVDWALPF